MVIHMSVYKSQNREDCQADLESLCYQQITFYLKMLTPQADGIVELSTRKIFPQEI